MSKQKRVIKGNSNFVDLHIEIGIKAMTEISSKGEKINTLVTKFKD